MVQQISKVIKIMKPLKKKRETLTMNFQIHLKSFRIAPAFDGSCSISRDLSRAMLNVISIHKPY